MGMGRPQVGGGGGGGAWGPKFWIWVTGSPIWASGLASTSGFSTARRYGGGEVGPNGTMRHIFRVVRARGKFINNYVSIKCYQRRGFGWDIW
jgi:hypothetical protein